MDRTRLVYYQYAIDVWVPMAWALNFEEMCSILDAVIVEDNSESSFSRRC